MPDDSSGNTKKSSSKITFQVPEFREPRYSPLPGITDRLNEKEKKILQERHSTVPSAKPLENQELTEEEKMDLLEKQALLRLQEYEYAQNKRTGKDSGAYRNTHILMWPVLLFLFLIIFYGVLKLFQRMS